MNNWIQTKIDVGTRDKNTEYAFEFLKTPECKPIEIVAPTCDCTTAELTDTKLLLALFANQILEGIYFYAGFAALYALGKSGKMLGSTQMIRFINNSDFAQKCA